MMVVTTALYWLMFWHASRRPTYFPYFDAAFLSDFLWIHAVFYGGGWGVLLALSIWARRRNWNPKWMVHIVSQAMALWGVVSYFLGHLTTPYLGVALTIPLLLAIFFGGRPAALSLATLGVILVATVAAEQLDWIPYAPLLSAQPVVGQNLAKSWVFGLGGFIALQWAASVPLLVVVLASAREREQRLARASRAMGRYLPPQLAERVLSGDVGVSPLAHERRRLAIFFSDIEGFTTLADELEPEESAGMLNRYVAEMARIAERHGATLNQIIGDGLMVIFGAPLATEPRDQAVRAVRMALEMQDAIPGLCERWRDEGVDRSFAVRMAINSGYATVGDFGSEGRVTYSAIGTSTNIAARIEEHCPPGEILVSHATWMLCNDEFEFEEMGSLDLKGIRGPVRAYRVKRALVTPLSG